MRARAAGWLVAVAGAFAVAACSTDRRPGSAQDDEVTTIQAALNTTVVVTVTDSSGAVQVGRLVHAQKQSTGAFIQSNTTNSQGRATFSLADEQYRFATTGSPDGYYFYSGTPGSCTTPGCTSASITVTVPVAVTLIDGWGNPVADQGIDAIAANGDVENTGLTDTQGHVSLSVDPGTYHFRAIYGNAYFLSAACAVPGCVSATVQIEKPVQVVVTDGYGVARADETVIGVDSDNAQVNAETTDSTGQASLYLPPGSFTIRVIDGNMYFDTPTCVIPGCTNASLAVTDVVVTVTDADGNPVPNLTVRPVDDSNGTEINWIDTDAEGHADVFVPAGAYKFRVVVDGNYIESGPDGHCQVTGCRTASITIPAPVVVTVVNASNQPIANQEVTAEPQGCGVPPATMTTDAQGHASFTLSAGGWRFRANCGCEAFYSGSPGSCVVPGCVSAHITMICGGCTGKPDGFACNDGNACTQTDACQSGACVGANPVTCSAQDQCHVAGTCNMQTGACSNPAKANGTSCSDGNSCTQTDTCQAGTCTGGNPVTCTAQDQCHDAGTCNTTTGTCSNPAKANGSACNDGDACTQTDSCQSGSCSGGNPVTCTAQDQCHNAGTCNTSTGVCSNPAKANGSACNDGDACTQTDSCQSGACTGSNPVTCVAQDQCHNAGACNSSTGACSNPAKSDGTACNDSNACTQTDTCQSGACTGGNPVTCVASDQCHGVGTCNTSTGACSNPALAEGSSCSDGNSCTGPDTCHSGSCTPGGSTCASITLTHSLDTQIQPTLSATLAADDLSVVPGDPVTFTGVVTHTGLSFNQGGDIRLTNSGSSTFTVTGFQQTLEYLAESTGQWTPFARIVFDGTNNVVPETTLVQIAYSWVVPRTDGSGVTYPPNPPNQNQATGTTIDPGGNAHWGFGGPNVQIPADILDTIFDPAQSGGVRSVVRFDMPSGPAQAAAFPIQYPGFTGELNDFRSELHISFYPQPEQVYLLSSNDTGPLAPGVTRVFTGTIATPTMTPFPAFPGETEASYVGRLTSAQPGLATSAFFTGTAPGAFPAQQTVPVHIDIEIPFLQPLKAGPTTTNAGFTQPYTVALKNLGRGAALALALTDTVDGDPVTMTDLTLPATVDVAPATVLASFKVASPLGRPGGPMTDVATINWQDRNGTFYGPVTSSFTGNVNAGHSEGYLSMKAVAGITDVIGIDKPFVVTALDPYGNPAPGVVVHFGVTGVNPQTDNIATGADGKATFAYAGTTMGNDTVVASATITTTLITLAPVHVQWGTAVGTPCTGRATPLDIMLVVDVSGSMVLEPPSGSSAGKLEAARAAAHRFIDNLVAPLDQVGVVVFRAGVDAFAPLSSDAAAVEPPLDNGIDGGIFCATNLCDPSAAGSNLALGIDAALVELASPRHRPDATKVVVYIGDGGISVDPAPALGRLRDSGARAVVIALGAAIDGSVARQVASSPNDYFYSPSGAGVDFAFNNLNQDLCRNLAPIVSAGGDQGAYGVRLPDLLTLQGEVHDDGPDGDARLTSTWTVLSGPGPVTFLDASAPVTKALFTDPGTYVLQLAASDGFLTVADRATITVDPEPNLAGASLLVALETPSPLTTGTPETITATLSDAAAAPIGNFPVKLTIAGANPAQATAITNASGVATFKHTGARSGTDQIHATAFAPTFQIDSAIVPLTWNDPPIGGPLLTQGWIASPAHQSTIMGGVEVKLSNTVTLTSGTLTYWVDSHPEQVHTLASGLSGGPGAKLATFDTTLLANGSYILALDGVDDANHQRLSEVLVTVAGDYKPGRVVVEVTDFTVPLAGIPITIGRRYDSLEKDNVGDFGHGWSLMLGHPKLEVDQAHGVSMTMPNGRRVSFHFAPTFPAVGLVGIGFLLLPAYAPEPGVFGTLTSNGCPVLMYNVTTGQPPVCFAALAPSELEYAPSEYTYTDPYGTAYVMGNTGELRSVRDRQGNSLTFQPNGIISSAGKSISFERDPQGRIKKVNYPAFFGPDVDAVKYGYDPAGDLTHVQLPTSGYAESIVTYTYGQHRLLTTVDPLDHAARTLTYDPVTGRLATDTDAIGTKNTYTYDLATRTTTTATTNPDDQGVVTQVFDERGLVLSETDPLNHTTTHEYDANRNETKRKNALEEETTVVYGDFGNQTSLTDPLGTTYTEYDTRFNLPNKFTDRLGHVTTIEYDDRGVRNRIADQLGTRFKLTSSEQGLPLIVEDAEGHRAYIEYDAAGNNTAQTDWLGRVTRAQYDEAGHKLSETTARGATKTYSYLPQGWLSLTTQPNGYAILNVYDPNGNIYYSYDSDGSHGQTNPKFDPLNHLTEVWHVNDGPGGTRVKYTRDFRGNPVTMTDENDHTTSYEYDKVGNLTKTTFPRTKVDEDPKSITRTYDELNRLASVKDERDNTTTYKYQDGCGCSDRVTKVIDPLLRETVTTYDANGRKISVKDANNHTTSFVYDVRNHLLETHFEDGTAVIDTYDTRGRRVMTKDQTNEITTFGYDDQGQLTSVTDPLSHVSHYAYDLDGNLTSVTDANGHTTSYEYDFRKRKTKRTLPLGKFETFGYDLAGRLTAHTDFHTEQIPGKTTAMTYDVRDRMLRKDPAASLGEASHVYTYFANGLRHTATDPSGTTTYEYDARDRLVTKAATAGTLTYDYDFAGNLASIRASHDNGASFDYSVDYTWDNANQLVSVTDNRVTDNQTGGATATTATFTATRRPATLTQPNGIGVTYSYDDPLDRVTSMSWRHGTSTEFGRWSYSHNPRGQRTSATDITGRSVAYDYDADGLLASETITGDPRGATFNGALSYVPDGAGNRLSRTSSLPAVPSATYSYNANDELDADTYDANGNTTSSGGHTYAYDFENRLVSKDNGAVTITYDCDGNRVAKTVGGVTTRYLVDDLNPTGYVQVLEEVVGGVVETRYTYGASIVSQTRNVSSAPTTSYYGFDAHGNTTFLTDASGNITDSYDYDAWGMLVARTGTTPNTRLYVGEELDSDLGLINLRARQYRADTGRFLTIDPLMGVQDRPVTFDRYLYGNGDPVNNLDPSGGGVTAAEYALIASIVGNFVLSRLVAKFVTNPVKAECIRQFAAPVGASATPGGPLAPFILNAAVTALCLI